jgi:uncharacterized membrane protein SpoIIM required for sporulation
LEQAALVNVHQFINSRHAEWRALEDFVQVCGRLSLARVPLDQYRAGTALYRRAVADLAYARMRYPGSSAVKELERLVARTHSVVYQARRTTSIGWWQFWLRTWPATVRGAARPILLATGIFWIAAIVGLLAAAAQPQFDSFFISPSMREGMSKGHLWTEHLTSTAPQASSAIATNNISVTLVVWALGITFGVGTVWQLILNGLMLGAIFSACMRTGLFGALGEFVIGHGCLELPAIWIAAGAGFLMAEALIVPGRYSRSVELQLAARRSVRIVVGTIPMLLIAATVEAFISPSDLPGWIKASLGAVLALAYLAYILAAPAQQPNVADEPSL